MPAFFCSELARSQGDQLFGTAKQIQTFVAIEYPQSWREKAVESEIIPPELRKRLSELKRQQPQTRVLLIRQKDSKHRTPRCFIAKMDGASSPRVHCRMLDGGYTDVIAMLDDPASSPQWTGGPIFLICNHGKHDKCCALHGNPVLSAVSASTSVWESSHIGGCRFAANMLSLSDGLLFGQLTPEDAVRTIDACEAGKLDIANFRGRSTFSKPVQAAEHFVRRDEPMLQGIHDLELRGSECTGEHSWTTSFRFGSSMYAVDHAVSKSDAPRILACSDTEPEFAWTHQLLSIRRSSSTVGD